MEHSLGENNVIKRVALERTEWQSRLQQVFAIVDYAVYLD